MEIVYKVDKRTFKDREEAEQYEKELRSSLVTKKHAYKHFYLPTGFRNYVNSLKKLKSARKNLKIRNYTSVANLCTAHEEWLVKKQKLREYITEYKDIKNLIRQLSTAKKTKKIKKRGVKND